MINDIKLNDFLGCIIFFSPWVSTYLLHLVFITVHNADTKDQLLCVIIIEDAIQIIAKTWWEQWCTMKENLFNCFLVSFHVQFFAQKELLAYSSSWRLLINTLYKQGRGRGSRRCLRGKKEALAWQALGPGFGEFQYPCKGQVQCWGRGGES